MLYYNNISFIKTLFLKSSSLLNLQCFYFALFFVSVSYVLELVINYTNFKLINHIGIIQLILGVYSFLLSFTITFRINTSYTTWSDSVSTVFSLIGKTKQFLIICYSLIKDRNNNKNDLRIIRDKLLYYIGLVFCICSDTFNGRNNIDETDDQYFAYDSSEETDSLNFNENTSCEMLKNIKTAQTNDNDSVKSGSDIDNTRERTCTEDDRELILNYVNLLDNEYNNVSNNNQINIPNNVIRERNKSILRKPFLKKQYLDEYEFYCNKFKKRKKKIINNENTSLILELRKPNTYLLNVIEYEIRSLLKKIFKDTTELTMLSSLLTEIVDKGSKMYNIGNIPIIHIYNQFINFSICLYMFIFTFNAVLIEKYYSGIFVFFMSYIIYLPNIVSIQMITPFGIDENDIELEILYEGLKKDSRRLYNQIIDKSLIKCFIID